MGPRIGGVLDSLIGWLRGADGLTDDAIEAIEEGVEATAEAEASICAKAGGEVSCFVSGTLVHTEVGLIPIEEVEVGDFVWAWDASCGSWCLAEVERILVREYEGDVTTIVVGDVAIESTGDHPFWVVAGDCLSDRPAAEHVPPEEILLTAHGRWVDARYLRVGDQLRAREGGDTVAASISTRQERLTVYNLAVTRLRTYAVGACGVLVHNRTDGNFFAEGAGGASTGATKRGPKPWPTGAHNQKIAQRIKELKNKLGPDWEHVGGGNLTEEVVDTMGGLKSSRRPDITFRNKKTGEIYREQVGKATKSGNPVAREGDALDDLEQATGIRPGFTPYP